MKNQTEQINGLLCHRDGRWVVVSGYGTFPLCRVADNRRTLHSKLSDEDEVAAWVRHGEVIHYNFAPATIDGKETD